MLLNYFRVHHNPINIKLTKNFINTSLNCIAYKIEKSYVIYGV